jgi:hypothetical protein
MSDLISRVVFKRRSFRSPWTELGMVRRGAALVPILLLQLAAAHATPAFTPSAGCVPDPYTTGDLTCTNNGTINVTGTDGIDAPAINGNATTNNSGNVNVTTGDSGGIIYGIRTTTDIGKATTNNTGNVNVTGSGFNVGILTSTTFSVGTQFGTAPEGSNNTATTTNYGNVNLTTSGGVGIFTTTASGLATLPGFGDGIFAMGNATTTNYGNVVVNASLPNLPITAPGDSLPLFGISLGTIGIETTANLGDATTVNNGSVSVAAFNGKGILTSTNTGNATTINAGIVTVVGTANNNISTVCGGFCGSSVGVTTSATEGNATLINSGIIAVSGINNVGVSMVSSGTSLVVNSGIISAPGGIAIQFTNPLDPDILTLLPGSFIVGTINLIGVDDTVNVNAGNQNLTFNTLAGATITGNVPFVVSGNRIVSVDPTGFAVSDRALMDFTHAVSATLGGRASDAAASGGAPTGGALGFAAYDDSASRFEDAFAQVMGYAKAPDNAIVFKNPSMTAPDGTTVWAKGFYGQRTQQADGLLLRNVSRFYGGGIGVDRLVQPGLWLGGLVGGGTINTSLDLNSGSGASDIVFAGLYGRKDFGPAFVDFALLGGHTGNRTTRNVNNNLLANGLEVATASFGGWFISPEIAAGYRYDFMPGWTLTPAARLRYLAASYDGFTESGSSANLSAGDRTLQNAEERADLTLTHTMPLDLGRLQLGVTAGVLGQQRVGAGNVNATLLGQALAFATPGKSSIYGGYAGGSLDWRMRNGFSVFAAAEYTALSDSSNTVTGKAGLRYGF